MIEDFPPEPVKGSPIAADWGKKVCRTLKSISSSATGKSTALSYNTHTALKKVLRPWQASIFLSSITSGRISYRLAIKPGVIKFRNSAGEEYSPVIFNLDNDGVFREELTDGNKWLYLTPPITGTAKTSWELCIDDPNLPIYNQDEGLAKGTIQRIVIGVIDSTFSFTSSVKGAVLIVSESTAGGASEEFTADFKTSYTLIMSGYMSFYTVQLGEWYHNGVPLQFDPTGTSPDSNDSGKVTVFALGTASANTVLYAVIDTAATTPMWRLTSIKDTKSETKIHVLLFSNGIQRHIGSIFTMPPVELQTAVAQITLGAENSTSHTRTLTSITRQVFVPKGSNIDETYSPIFSFTMQSVVTEINLSVQPGYTDLMDDKMYIWAVIPSDTLTTGTIARFVDRDANTSTTYRS